MSKTIHLRQYFAAFSVYLYSKTKEIFPCFYLIKLSINEQFSNHYGGG